MFSLGYQRYRGSLATPYIKSFNQLADNYIPLATIEEALLGFVLSVTTLVTGIVGSDDFTKKVNLKRIWIGTWLARKDIRMFATLARQVSLKTIVPFFHFHRLHVNNF